MVGTCLEVFYVIGVNFLRVEFKGMFYFCRKFLDIGKVNKMKREEVVFFFLNLVFIIFYIINL